VLCDTEEVELWLLEEVIEIVDIEVKDICSEL
jgi:hypothetical protein